MSTRRSGCSECRPSHEGLYRNRHKQFRIISAVVFDTGGNGGIGMRLIDLFRKTLAADGETAVADHDDLEFEIARLDLQPGDILVARFKERLPLTAINHIRETFNRVVPNVKCLGLENGADLAILSATEIEARSTAPTSDEAAV
jgi:hypothetical protein